MAQTAAIRNILALDVGEKRVGLAAANTLARLPRPYATLIRDDRFWGELEKVIKSESIAEAVIGLPRNLEGNETQQTAATKNFIAEFKQRFTITVHMQDEAATSVKAEEELKARGRKYSKGDIDALAAAYILEDYLQGAK